jgi:aspartyl/asparaginyl beta-hydroxylase (cupin superfamily)
MRKVRQMTTKNVPSKFDCCVHALPDEPMFTPLGRDPEFKSLVTEWANLRQNAIKLRTAACIGSGNGKRGTRMRCSRLALAPGQYR